MVTGHGKTKEYLHLFKLIETQTCLCGAGDQTKNQLLYEFEILNKERDILKL